MHDEVREYNHEARKSRDDGDEVDEPSIKDLSRGTKSRTSKVVTKGQASVDRTRSSRIERPNLLESVRIRRMKKKA